MKAVARNRAWWRFIYVHPSSPPNLFRVQCVCVCVASQEKLLLHLLLLLLLLTGMQLSERWRGRQQSSNKCSVDNSPGQMVHDVAHCVGCQRVAQAKLHVFKTYTLYFLLKLLRLAHYVLTAERFVKIIWKFEFYFSFFKTLLKLLCRIHILICIKNNRNKT